MPELPEVETARRRLSDAAKGQQILQAWVADDPNVFDREPPQAVAAALIGRTIRAVHRHGKYFWCELDEKPWPVLHFGMTGELILDSPPSGARPPHTKLELRLANGTRVMFRDPRRFGRIRLARDPRREPPLARLGRDPMAEMPTLADLIREFSRTRRNIKAVLLDQRLFAGVGNWMADEVLFQAGIAPARGAASLERREIKRLRQALGRVVRLAVAAAGEESRFPRAWLFHRRWSRQPGTTLSGDPIVREPIAGRTTAWVPAVQK